LIDWLMCRTPPLSAAWAFWQALMLYAGGSLLVVTGAWWFGAPVLVGGVMQTVVGLVNARRGNWIS
jgi:hypothetical protein